MWIVQLALRRTYTFVVMALLIAAVSGVAIYRMSTDIFPEINIPVVSVVWQYTGMPADEIEQRIILINERVLTTSVNDIEHIESQSLFGVGVIRHLLLSRGEDRGGRGAGDGHQPGDPEDHAAGHQPAVHRAIQRHQRADRADRRQQRHADRAADLRLRRQLHHPAAGRPCRARGCRSRGAASGRRSWSTSTSTSSTPAASRRQDVQTAINTQNLIIPAGTAKIGADANITSSSTAAPTWSPRSTTCRSRRSTASRSTSRTWPTSAWATWCRPTSSAATAAGPC